MQGASSRELQRLASQRGARSRRRLLVEASKHIQDPPPHTSPSNHSMCTADNLSLPACRAEPRNRRFRQLVTPGRPRFRVRFRGSAVTSAFAVAVSSNQPSPMSTLVRRLSFTRSGTRASARDSGRAETETETGSGAAAGSEGLAVGAPSPVPGCGEALRVESGEAGGCRTAQQPSPGARSSSTPVTRGGSVAASSACRMC